jgi:HK97 family phage major capsid protein
LDTIDSLVGSIERDLKNARERYETAKLDSRIILESARNSGSRSLTKDESARFELLRREGESAKRDVSDLEDKLVRARSARAEEHQSDALGQDTHRTNAPGTNRTATMHVGSEARTYSPESDPHGKQFLSDVARGMVLNDYEARERLNRHMHEERVERGVYLERAGDIATSGMGGLVIPQYLTDMTALATANMRPLANVATQHELPPEGMNLIIPTLTATGAAIQTENATVQDTGVTETDVTVPVLTAAGSQTVSRQAVERGTGIDNWVMADLTNRVASLVDFTMLNRASTGIQFKAQVVAYTSASPTPAECYPFIFQAESKAEAALLSMARVDTVVMRPNRWNWFVSGVASTWPTLGSLNSGVPPQMMGVSITDAYGPGIRAVLANGLRVCVDANIVSNLGVGTNQDQIYVLASSDLHLWEAPGSPVYIRAEQPLANQLSILLVAYEYFACLTSRYSNGVSAISGTGLVSPAGF